MPWSSSQQGLSPGSSFSRQDFVRRVRGLCARDQLLLPGETVLVMVSGGQDSLALLHLLASGELGEVAGGDVQVLHVNHALRGDDSEADEKLVRDFCRYRSIPLDVRRLPVSKLGAMCRQRRALCAGLPPRKWRRRSGLGGWHWAIPWMTRLRICSTEWGDTVVWMLWRGWVHGPASRSDRCWVSADGKLPGTVVSMA